MNFENLIEQLNKEGISLSEITRWLYIFFHIQIPTVYLSVEQKKILNKKLIEILNEI
jgi:hypothetical protein